MACFLIGPGLLPPNSPPPCPTFIWTICFLHFCLVQFGFLSQKFFSVWGPILGRSLGEFHEFIGLDCFSSFGPFAQNPSSFCYFSQIDPHCSSLSTWSSWGPSVLCFSDTLLFSSLLICTTAYSTHVLWLLLFFSPPACIWGL